MTDQTPFLWHDDDGDDDSCVVCGEYLDDAGECGCSRDAPPLTETEIAQIMLRMSAALAEITLMQPATPPGEGVQP